MMWAFMLPCVGNDNYDLTVGCLTDLLQDAIGMLAVFEHVAGETACETVSPERQSVCIANDGNGGPKRDIKSDISQMREMLGRVRLAGPTATQIES